MKKLCTYQIVPYIGTGSGKIIRTDPNPKLWSTQLKSSKLREIYILLGEYSKYRLSLASNLQLAAGLCQEKTNLVCGLAGQDELRQLLAESQGPIQGGHLPTNINKYN